MSPLTGTACADVHESSNAAIAAKNAILNSLSRMVGPLIVSPARKPVGTNSASAMPCSGKHKSIKDLRTLHALRPTPAAKHSVGDDRRAAIVHVGISRAARALPRLI
jgi:hypothetical protein